MISHKYKCVFVHIPKVAGQSIETFFLDLHGLDWESRGPLLLRPNHEPKVGPERLAHLTAMEYTQFHYLSEELMETYFKFSFVRNPWSRAVSFYKYGNYHLYMTFADFLSDLLPSLIKETPWFYGDQYQYLYDGEKIKVDFVGYFENLNTDFAKVCNTLNLSVDKLPYVNKSKSKDTKTFFYVFSKRWHTHARYFLKFKKDRVNSKDYRDYYTPELSKIIEKIYHRDIEAFGYDFENSRFKS